MYRQHSIKKRLVVMLVVLSAAFGTFSTHPNVAVAGDEGTENIVQTCTPEEAAAAGCGCGPCHKPIGGGAPYCG